MTNLFENGSLGLVFWVFADWTVPKNIGLCEARSNRKTREPRPPTTEKAQLLNDYTNSKIKRHKFEKILANTS